MSPFEFFKLFNMSLNPQANSFSPKPDAAVPSNASVKVVSADTGAPITKSGQTIGMTFTDSVVASYSNLFNAPALAILFFSTIVLYVAEYSQVTMGPIEIVINHLKNLIAAKSITTFTLIVCTILVKFLTFLLPYKRLVMDVIMFSIPYFRKPSTKNLKVTGILLGVVLLVDSSIFTVIALSQMWFLVTELRNPKHKMLVGVITMSVLMFAWLDISDQPSPPTIEPTTSRTTPPVTVSTFPKSGLSGSDVTTKKI
jgi:hypothetical protein